jgi:predicted PurR-regulated permease PerM
MAFPSPTEKQARVLWTSITALSIGILIFLGLVLLWAFGQVLQILASVLVPLAIAGILAYLLDPIVAFFETHHIPRRRSIVLVFLIGLTAVVLLLSTVVPRLVFEAGELIENAPGYSRQLSEKIQQWMNESTVVKKINRLWATPVSIPSPNVDHVGTDTNSVATAGTRATEAHQLTEMVLTWFNKILPELAKGIWSQVRRAASLIGFLVGFFLIPIYVFYFLLEKKGIKQNWSDYLPLRESRLKEEVIFILSSINDCLIVFFRGQVLVALCSGTLLTLGFLFLGLHYALLLGVMAGVLGIIPYLGTIVSLVPALTLAAVQFGDWIHPVMVLLIFGIVNLNESLVVSPRIIGNRVGLHPLAIIIAVMVGTTLLGGILGGILAIPLTAALRSLLHRYVYSKR